MGPVLPSSYLRAILAREAVDDSAASPLQVVEEHVGRICDAWAGRLLLDVYPVGAIAKGTANGSAFPMDLVASLDPQTPHSMAQVYQSLFEALDRLGLDPVRRPVSIAVPIEGVLVDIVPARRESIHNDIHEIFSARRGVPIKTSLTQHVLDTVQSGRQEEIRILKLWRDQHGLEFPSFYLELSTITALRRRPLGELAENVWAVLAYYEALFTARAMLDPANANNVVSDEMTATEKAAVRDAARFARAGRPWSEIVT